MFIYFGKRFDAANVGRTVVGVKCDKCACEYYYELARIGTGSSTAPYAIGTGAAAQAAEEQSQRDLQDRLASEAELVPCPKCKWINDELVKGYRRSQYQGFTKPTVVITIIGTAMTLLCGYFISKGAPRDQRYAPYFLYGGPALFAAFAAAMLSLRTWLRSRIRPNRYYPRAPQLPPGSPPALILDPSTEELRPAKPEPPQGNSADDWQDCQVGRTLFPLLCCDCLRPATTEHAFAIPVGAKISLEIPWCAACAKRPQGVSRRGWFIFAAIGLLVGGSVFAFWRYEVPESTMIFVGLVIAFVVAIPLIVAWIKPSGPVEAVVVDPSRGVLRMRFRNAEYGRLVAKQAKETDETPGKGSKAESSTAIKE